MMRFDYLHDPLPDFIEAVRSVRLPRHLHLVAIVFATVLFALLVAGGVEALRVRAALTIEQRAEDRFERSRDAMNRARVQWQQLDELLARDRRLREIRLSGSAVAARMAELGNAVPRHAWLASMNAASSTYGLKGYARDLHDPEVILANLLQNRTLPQPQAIRISREDGRPAGRITFEARADAGP